MSKTQATKETKVLSKEEFVKKVQEAEAAKGVPVIRVDGKKVTVDGKTTEFSSKSAAFKWLYDNQELTVGEIAKLTGSRYQFVYSVLDNHTGGNTRKASSTGPSKSQMFRDDFDAGMKVGEIAKKHNANYTFVFTVIKKYKMQKDVQKAREVINS